MNTKHFICWAAPYPVITLLRKLATFVAVVPLLLTAGCSEAEFPRGKYQVIDSGAWISTWGPFIWLDDNRLVFVSSESMRPDTKHLARAIWETGNPPVVDWKNLDFLWCFDGHNLGFKQKDGENPWFKGPVGSEQPWNRPVCPSSNSGFVRPLITGGTCDCSGDRDGPWKGRNAKLLKDGHGWLEIAPAVDPTRGLENLPVTFHPQKGASIPMPFLSREMGAITFSPWRNAYFIEASYFNPITKGGESPWPKKLPRHAWWLELDGRLTKIVIPPAMKNKRGYWDELVPTKTGIATISRAGEKSNHDSGEQGVYLIKGDRIEKILDGLVEKMGPSPDGCHLGVASAPNNATNHLGEYDKQFRTMKVIELCNSPEGK